MVSYKTKKSYKNYREPIVIRIPFSQKNQLDVAFIDNQMIFQTESEC